MTTNNIQSQLYDAYNRHDPTAAIELYDAEATHQEVAQSNTRHGRAAIAEGLQHFFTWFPDACWDARTRIVSPDGKIAVTYLLTGTLKAPIGSIPAHGQRLSLRGVHVLHLVENRIAYSEDYWDAATFKRQMQHV